MSGTSDISAILAALAAQPAAPTPSQTSHQAQPPPPHHQQPPVPAAHGTPQFAPPAPGQSPAAAPRSSLPQPTSSGSLSLNAIKPVNQGSVSIQDAMMKARGIAAEKGITFDTGRRSTGPRDDARMNNRYRRSRSRSRSPRRERVHDSYTPHRDERRGDPRRGGAGYGRDRSRSPRGRNTFSPPRGSARERSPPANDNNEIILIDSSLVGLVIGRQGENLRRIEEVTATRIQFLSGPEAAGPQRQCRVSGNPRARMDAKREINRIIEENGGNPAREAGRGGSASTGSGSGRNSAKGSQPMLREGENSIQIMVPDRTVGLIIGRGGETIRDLQERSGCHVNIVGENKSVNGLRPVNLIGTPQAANTAKDLILEIVESDTRDGPNGPNGPNGARPEPRRDGDVHGAGNAKASDSVTVPSDAVGMIIGRGGETIKEMQNMTGCKINVTQAAGADIEREIGLVGTRQAIDEAKRAIWEKVDSMKDKGSGYGPRRGGSANDQGRPPYGQAYGQAPGQSEGAGPWAGANAGAPGDASAADPYAIYGGYQNYVAMWMAYQAQAAQQAQQGQGQADQRPPGAA